MHVSYFFIYLQRVEECIKRAKIDGKFFSDQEISKKMQNEIRTSQISIETEKKYTNSSSPNSRYD